MSVQEYFESMGVVHKKVNCEVCLMGEPPIQISTKAIEFIKDFKSIMWSVK